MRTPILTRRQNTLLRDSLLLDRGYIVVDSWEQQIHVQTAAGRTRIPSADFRALLDAEVIERTSSNTYTALYRLTEYGTQAARQLLRHPRQK